MLRTSWNDKVLALNPCDDGRDWIIEQKGKSQQASWDSCPDGSWMLWLLGQKVKTGSKNHKKLVLLVCKIARTSLKYVPKGEKRPIKAIQTAEAWAKGKATIEEVSKAAAEAAEAAEAVWVTEAAAEAAAAAAVAARVALVAEAAAQATAWAAGATSWVAAFKQFAKMVRKDFPKPPRLG